MTSSSVTSADRADAGRRFRTALFVDFDNVYIGLQRLDPVAAEAFATNPAHWLSELESGTDPEGDFSRRFLIRACYLNPSRFSQFRPNFTRAGFQVVDCPSLTQQGKSSADINLVLDAVDALAAPTHYEEFVIVSADADFTPLALRCRAADRRVTIITASPAASAYRAVADTVITADELADLVTHTASTLPVESPVAEAAGQVADPPSRGGRAGPRKKAATGARRSPRAARRLRRAQGRAPARPDGRPPGAAGHRRRSSRRRPSRPCRNPVGGCRRVPRPGWRGRARGRRLVAPAGLGVGHQPGSARPTCRGAVTDTAPSALQNQVVAVTDTPGLSQSTYRRPADGARRRPRSPPVRARARPRGASATRARRPGARSAARPSTSSSAASSSRGCASRRRSRRATSPRRGRTTSSACAGARGCS